MPSPKKTVLITTSITIFDQVITSRRAVFPDYSSLSAMERVSVALVEWL